MSIEPDQQQRQRKDLADTLHQLRKSAGLSGEHLAARCAISQSKISRIERGKTLPSVVDVERILTALDVPPDTARNLLELARIANVGYASWHSYASVGLWKRQTELKALTESSTVIRHFLPAMPSGLLQIPEYARLALTPVVSSAPGRDIDKAVAARISRQTVLGDGSRRFVFLLTEQAVRWPYATPQVMSRQCAHLAAAAARPNVDLAVIPLGTRVTQGPLNIFTVYDDRLVLAELFSGGVALRDPRDVSHHLDLFEFFYGHALTGQAAADFCKSVADEFMQTPD